MPGSSSRTRRPSYTSTDRDMRAVTQLRRAGAPQNNSRPTSHRGRVPSTVTGQETHTHTTIASKPSIPTASRRRRDTFKEVLQQMSGGNLGGARVRRCLSRGHNNSLWALGWPGPASRGKWGFLDTRACLYLVCDGTLVLREGSRLCLGGCRLQMYTYTGPYGIFLEVFLFLMFVVLPYAVEWTWWTRRARTQVG